MRKFAVSALVFSYLIFSALAEGQTVMTQAVESVGEINARGNTTGTVIAGTEADLILTLIADMSQAEPGEEIESIQITIPSGFTAKDGAVKSVKTNDDDVPDFESVVDRNRVIVTLPTLIRLTTVITIEFTVDAPPTPIPARAFIVSLLNVFQNPIIVSVKPGNADGRVNNDSFSIKTVAATKPDPPSDLRVQQDPSGENNLVISWTKSEDPAVSGYFIYRSDKGDDPIADITDSQQTSYTDRNLKPGEEYSYTASSYKTQTLRSDSSNTESAVAPEDTQVPQPPAQPEIVVTDKGIELGWEPSPSLDVVKYIIYRGASLDALNSIGEVEAGVSSYIDESPPTVGSYLYAIVAVDDVENESGPAATQRRQALAGAEPQPNPFTPLSADSRFNQITFPAAMVEGGEGTFAIKIYDLEGDLVFEAEAEEGSTEIRWDGRDTNDEYVSSGIYVYQATMGDEYKIGSVIVAK